MFRRIQRRGWIQETLDLVSRSFADPEIIALHERIERMHASIYLCTANAYCTFYITIHTWVWYIFMSSICHNEHVYAHRKCICSHICTQNIAISSIFTYLHPSHICILPPYMGIPAIICVNNFSHQKHANLLKLQSFKIIFLRESSGRRKISATSKQAYQAQPKRLLST